MMPQPPETSDPPRTLGAALKHLGPGIVLASSIVGSGELIATTTVGAEAGFVLLWLIILGCAIKVAAQIAPRSPGAARHWRHSIACPVPASPGAAGSTGRGP